MYDPRPVCPYDKHCYRTSNAEHNREYQHPKRDGGAAAAAAAPAATVRGKWTTTTTTSPGVSGSPPRSTAVPPAVPPATASTHTAGYTILRSPPTSPGRLPTDATTTAASAPATPPAVAAGAHAPMRVTTGTSYQQRTLDGMLMPKRTIFRPTDESRKPPQPPPPPPAAPVGPAPPATVPPSSGLPASLLSGAGPRLSPVRTGPAATARASPPRGRGEGGGGGRQEDGKSNLPPRVCDVPKALPDVTATDPSNPASVLCAAYRGMPFLREGPELAEVLRAARVVAARTQVHPLLAWHVPHGVRLTGPFRVLAGVPFHTEVDRWCVDRDVADPPEVLCVAVRSTDGSRLLLHRDAPHEACRWIVTSAAPVRVVDSTAPCRVTFAKVSTLSIAQALAEFIDGGKSPETAAFKHHPPPSTSSSPGAAEHRPKPVAQTANRLGVVVPYDRKTEVGYREPQQSRKDLLRLLHRTNEGTLTVKQRADLEDQIRVNDISNDECDFGLGLELGHDFLSCVVPHRVTPVALQARMLLSTAYSLLGRVTFAHIVDCSLSRIPIVPHSSSSSSSLPP